MTSISKVKTIEPLLKLLGRIDFTIFHIIPLMRILCKFHFCRNDYAVLVEKMKDLKAMEFEASVEARDSSK